MRLRSQFTLYPRMPVIGGQPPSPSEQSPAGGFTHYIAVRESVAFRRATDGPCKGRKPRLSGKDPRASS